MKQLSNEHEGDSYSRDLLFETFSASILNVACKTVKPRLHVTSTLPFFVSGIFDLFDIRAHLHQASTSVPQQLFNDASDSVLIENKEGT